MRKTLMLIFTVATVLGVLHQGLAAKSKFDATLEVSTYPAKNGFCAADLTITADSNNPRMITPTNKSGVGLTVDFHDCDLNTIGTQLYLFSGGILPGKKQMVRLFVPGTPECRYRLYIEDAVTATTQEVVKVRGRMQKLPRLSGIKNTYSTCSD